VIGPGRYSLDEETSVSTQKGLGGPQSRSGLCEEEENSALPRIEPRLLVTITEGKSI
jgi:hypothetical protein